MFRRRDKHHPDASPPDPARSPSHPAADHNAFAALYAAFAGRVHAYALQRLHDDDLAADITSTVFTRALAGWSAFAPRGADGHGPPAIEGWLLTIARNAIIDHVRANHRLTILDADAWRHRLERASPDPAGAAIAPDERDRLLDALNRLNQTQQRIVLLRLQGWNGVEIAALLEMSPGAVRVAQHRAYARLRDLLAPTFAESSPRVLTTEPDHA